MPFLPPLCRAAVQRSVYCRNWPTRERLPHHQAVPILFGDNIGTTVTALLAGIGASIAARRAALTHFMFNVVGTVIFLPLFIFGFFPELVTFVTNAMLNIVPGSGTRETLNPKIADCPDSFHFLYQQYADSFASGGSDGGCGYFPDTRP